MKEERLLACFRTVFPAEPDETLRSATPDLIPKWDSTTQFILLQLVEEEFQARIPEDIGGELLSFQQFLNYVEQLN